MNLPLFALLAVLLISTIRAEETKITLSWEKEYLTIKHAEIPERSVRILYLEAFCRPGSTDRDWKETVIPHKTTQLAANAEGTRIELRNTLEDGVIVDHVVESASDGVVFRLTAKNPTDKESQAHWGQPCMRVDAFTGLALKHSSEDYLPKSFLFMNGKLERMPPANWAKKARYVPGQVWCPKHVDRNDVNPRPLSPDVPSNGLIGCFSADEEWILATAWEPYQELFQGVITCLHSDFRIGGLKPGESKVIRGKVYIVKESPEQLLARYAKDFPAATGRNTH